MGFNVSKPQQVLGSLAAIGALSFATPSFAQFENEEDNRIYRSAYFLGRGDTGIAVADDQEAIYYNPAGLAQGEGIYKRFVIGSPQLEISSKTRDVYQRIKIEEDDQIDVLKDQIGEPFHLGVTSMTALVFRRAALGALVSNRANLLVRKDPEFGGLETVGAAFNTNQALSFSLADAFFNQSLLVGGTVKYINRGEAGFEANIVDAQAIKDINGDELVKSGNGMGVDLGLMWQSGKNKRFSEHSLGLTLENVGDTTFDSDVADEEMTALKQTLNVGYGLGIGTKVSRMRFLVDYRDITGAVESNTYKRIHLGTEITFAEYIGVCAGLNQGYPTGGFYLDFRVFRADLGFYTEERGERIGMYGDQRYYLRLLVGL